MTEKEPEIIMISSEITGSLMAEKLKAELLRLAIVSSVQEKEHWSVPVGKQKAQWKQELNGRLVK